jgi:hypothetical protein
MNLLLVFSLLHSVLAGATWTQYSDRASLPKSVRERQRLRDLLAQVKVDYLSPQDKVRYAEIQEALTDDIDSDTNSFNYIPLFTIIGGAFLLVYLKNRKQATNTSEKQLLQEAREARIKRFTSNT